MCACQLARTNDIYSSRRELRRKRKSRLLSKENSVTRRHVNGLHVSHIIAYAMLHFSARACCTCIYTFVPRCGRDVTARSRDALCGVSFLRQVHGPGTRTNCDPGHRTLPWRALMTVRLNVALPLDICVTNTVDGYAGEMTFLRFNTSA